MARKYAVDDADLPFDLIPEKDRYVRRPSGGLGRVKKPSKRVRRAVFIRDKFTCQICGLDLSCNVRSDPYAGDWVMDLELGHLIPYLHGGPYHELNLQAECRMCNLKKGAN